MCMVLQEKSKLMLSSIRRRCTYLFNGGQVALPRPSYWERVSVIHYVSVAMTLR